MNWTEGTALVGRIGSGKTTILRELLEEKLKDGSGCLWFCIKPDEAEEAEKVIKKAGRKPIRIRPGGAVKLNPLPYELGRKGGTAIGLATILSDINEVINASDKKGEDFWITNFTVALMHAVTLVSLVLKERATISDTYHLLMTTPESFAQVTDEHWRKRFCWQIVSNAREMYPNDRRVLTATNYLCELLPNSGEKVRGAVLSQVTNVLLPFTLPPLLELTDSTTHTPEDLFDECVILDLDVLTYGKLGQVFQLLFSFLFQEALLRRDPKNDFVFVRDEYQRIAHAQRDIQAQVLSRSQRLCSVIAFQSIPVLVDGMGGGLEAQTKAQAIFSQHVHKYMLNNACQETNDINARIIGMERQLFYSFSGANRNEKLDWWDFFAAGNMPNFSASQQFHFRVTPAEFTRLLTGGHENNGIVEAFYHNGHSYQKVFVQQCINKNLHPSRHSRTAPSCFNWLRRLFTRPLGR